MAILRKLDWLAGSVAFIAILIVVSPAEGKPKPTEAERMFLQSIEPVAASHKQTSDKAYETYRQGVQAYHEGRSRDALQFYQEALILYERENDFYFQSLILSNMSFVYFNNSEYSNALEYASSALSVAERAKDPNVKSLALYALGGVYEVFEKYDEAIDAYNESLRLARNIGKTNRVVRVLRVLGRIYTDIGRYNEAFRFYQETVYQTRDAENLGHTGRPLIRERGRAFLGLARLYKRQANFSSTLDAYNKSLAIAKEVDDFDTQALVLVDLGNFYRGLGYENEAISYYRQGMAMAERTQDWDLAISTRAVLEYFNGSRNPDLRLRRLKDILNAARVDDDLSSQIWALRAIGTEYTKSSEFIKAFQAYEEALILANSIENSRASSDIYASLGALMEEQEDFFTAIVFYKKSIDITQKNLQGIQNLPLEIQQNYVSINAYAYRQLIDLLLEQGRIIEAQQILELLKVQELREFTDNERTGESFPGVSLLPKEEEIIAEYTTLIAFGQQLRDCETSRCSNLSALRTQRDQQFQQYRDAVASLVTFIKDRLNEGDDPDLLLNPTGFATKAKEIINQQPGTVVIYPLVLDDKLWLLWAADGRVISRREIPVNRTEMGNGVIEFRSLIEDRYSDPDEIKDLGQKLYNWLIAPIEAELLANQDIKHLVFSLDRTTRYLPMGALHDGEQYLIDKYTVTTILSAALTDVSSRSPVGTENVTILGAGVSQKFENFNALSHVPIELDAIIREQDQPDDTVGLYSGQQLLDPEFTYTALRDSLGGQQFLHIATHGEFIPGRRDDSYLLMGDGEKLPIPRIETLNTYMEDLHMVVLSACQTALGGPNEEGLEIAGLGYYFLKSEVDAVMASLWNVNDSSTSKLMQAFYQTLSESTEDNPITKAEALRTAQLALINSNEPSDDDAERFKFIYETTGNEPRPESGLAHPYYWAPFILIGNGL